MTAANNPIIVCDECGKPIIKRNRHVRFCSDKCRVRNARKKQAEKRS